MWRMRRARCKVQKEGLVGRNLLGRSDELDRLVYQILSEMVALLRRLGWLDLVVVIDQVGILLVGIAAQEAIIALEAPSQWPAVVGASGRFLFR